MERILELKTALNVTLTVMLVGGLIFAFGFGSTVFIARQEVEKEANVKVSRDIDYVKCYIDGQLQRVEDAAYSVASRNFGRTVRHEDGTSHVEIDPKTFVRPTPDECYLFMRQFMEANPIVTGIILAFEPYVYPDVPSPGSFTPFVSRVGDEMVQEDVGLRGNVRHRDWYKEAVRTGQGYWAEPFHHNVSGRIMTCYSIPVYGFGGRLVGVLAIDIDTEEFGRKCSEVAPYPEAEVTLADQQFRFIYHPDTAFILRTVEEVGRYNGIKSDDSIEAKMRKGEGGSYTINKGMAEEALFFFEPIERAHWMLTITCPERAVFGGVDKMKTYTTIIAVVSILIMVLLFIFLFRHIQKITLGRASIERDLQVASAIQKGMLPKLYPAFPDCPALDVYGFLQPAKSVGGDLYDYFIRDGKLFFCIGDVSGKGIPASLFMAVIRALFRNVSLHTDDPAAILSSLNSALCEGNEHNMFCTMFLGVLDIKTGHLDYCNAGHNAPIVRTLDEAGTVHVAYAQTQVNIAVGVFEDFPYVKEAVEMKPGEAIFLYTDGVTEAENVEKKLFGDEATLTTLAEARRHHIRTAKEFVEYVFSAVQHHTAGTEQSDDITMVVVEFRG